MIGAHGNPQRSPHAANPRSSSNPTQAKLNITFNPNPVGNSFSQGCPLNNYYFNLIGAETNAAQDEMVAAEQSASDTRDKAVRTAGTALAKALTADAITEMHRTLERAVSGVHLAVQLHHFLRGRYDVRVARVSVG